MNHDLVMLVKLKRIAFSTNYLNILHNYLKNKNQKVQFNNKFSFKKIGLMWFLKDL